MHLHNLFGGWFSHIQCTGLDGKGGRLSLAATSGRKYARTAIFWFPLVGLFFLSISTWPARGKAGGYIFLVGSNNV